MASAEHDVVVLGGGPAGYAVAFRAAVRGLSVAMVEEAKVGGTCLHWGCIPSKALLHVGGILDEVRESSRFGLDLAVNGIDVEAVNVFRQKVQDTLHSGLEGLVKARGVTAVNGRGTVADDARTVLVGDQRVTGRHVVVCTGSKVRSLPGIDVDGEVVITSDEATRLPRIPRRAVVIGAGAVGLEFASLWRSLGAEEVTVVEALDRIAPLEDADLSKALARAFRKRGITTIAPSMVEGVKVDGDVATVTVGVGDDTQTFEADTVLVAVGRAPRTEGVGLDELGVLTERGHVEVDAYGRTSVDGLWAAGDVLPTLALAHAGFAEGFVVADSIAGVDDVVPVDHVQVPRVTYTSPEVASVGLTEAAAKEAHGDAVETSTTSLRGNAKGIIHASDGFVKVITGGPDGAVLGVHAIGPHATDLIAEAQLITSWGALPAEVAALVHPHPTLAEAMGEAHLAAAGVPFHAH